MQKSTIVLESRKTLSRKKFLSNSFKILLLDTILEDEKGMKIILLK